MELTWADVISVGLAAGFFTAGLEQVFGAWRESRADTRKSRLQEEERQHQRDLQEAELDHQREMQEAERAHEREMRLDEAHAAAAPIHSEKLADVRAWLEYELNEVYGAEVDFYNVATVRPPDVQRPADAVALLRFVRNQHPTAEVRAVAADVGTRMRNHYNSVENIEMHGGTPTMEQFTTWAELAAELTDLVLSPRART